MLLILCLCDPCRIQTCNPHIRSVVLYSVELMDPKFPIFRKSAAKVLLFFDMCKFFCIFLQKNCLYRDFALIFSFLGSLVPRILARFWCLSSAARNRGLLLSCPFSAKVFCRFLSARRGILVPLAAGRSLPLLWGQPFLRARR